jgi:hypothetical protein
MELVRAGPQCQVHRTRAGVADLRVVGGGLDLELLDRVRGGWMPARACDTMLLDPSMVNSLLIVPVIVMPRRLSLSIGRCSAYDRSNDAPGMRRVRP